MLRSRLVMGGAAGVLLATAISCSESPSEPSLREGPPAAWSKTVPTGESTTTVIGDVAVIANNRAVLGVDPGTGRELWRVPSSEDARVDVAGDLLVHRQANSASEPVRFTVIDPADGRVVRRGGPVANPRFTRDAVITTVCGDEAGDCRTTLRDLRTGRARWTLPDDEVWTADTAVGVRRPHVPSTAQWFTLDPDSGRPVTWTGRKRFGHGAWYSIVVGRTLIATDHDPPSGDPNCTVALTAVEAGTTAPEWTAKVYGGRSSDGECEQRLAPSASGLDLIGDGRRMAASTVDGAPQVIDLASGKPVWQGDTRGVPIDGDGHSLLVREQADTGALALLDFATGRVFWRAPAPGLEGTSAGWETAVTRDRVAVSGAEGDRPFVLVYDAASGRRLGRFPGWLQGLGNDWVAVATKDPRTNTLAYEFVRI